MKKKTAIKTTLNSTILSNTFHTHIVGFPNQQFRLSVAMMDYQARLEEVILFNALVYIFSKDCLYAAGLLIIRIKHSLKASTPPSRTVNLLSCIAGQISYTEIL